MVHLANETEYCLHCSKPLLGEWQLHSICILPRLRAIRGSIKTEKMQMETKP